MANVIKGPFPETKKTTQSTEDKPVPSYLLHVSIVFSDPLIWRRIQVPGTYTLAQLHDVIQCSLGWSDSHVHQFLVGKISYEPSMKNNRPRESKRFDEGRYQLHTLEDGMQFMFSYLYDAGEGWEHEIQLEEIVPAERELDHPILLAGEMACPPEDIADIHLYNQLVHNRESGAHRNSQSFSELTGIANFDPENFDLEAARKKVASLRAVRKKK